MRSILDYAMPLMNGGVLRHNRQIKGEIPLILPSPAVQPFRRRCCPIRSLYSQRLLRPSTLLSALDEVLCSSPNRQWHPPEAFGGQMQAVLEPIEIYDAISASRKSIRRTGNLSPRKRSIRNMSITTSPSSRGDHRNRTGRL